MMRGETRATPSKTGSLGTLLATAMLAAFMLALAAVLPMTPKSAETAFPGKNGKIALLHSRAGPLSGYGAFGIVLAAGLLLCDALFLRVADSPVREIP